MTKNAQIVAERVVSRMYENDDFSQWLGIKVKEVWPGGCLLEMEVRKEMVNGFGICHGGITYSFADSALAFSCNSRGRMAVSIETNISHTKGVKVGDTLIAKAKEESLSNRVAFYTVIVTNQHNEMVGLFKGTVFRRSQEWEV